MMPANSFHQNPMLFRFSNMINKYAFLYQLLDLIPIKSQKVKVFRMLLRFYKKKNTLIILHKNGQKTVNPLRFQKYLCVRASGKTTGNTVIIDESQAKGCDIRLYFWDACNNTFEIGTNNMIHMTAYIRGDNGHATIGDSNYICGATLYLYCSGTTTLNIGSHNLFSESITFWGGEGHSVIDPATDTVSNLGGHITIGDNNWTCMNVCFLKHARIGNGCVIGYGSIVSGDLSKDNKCVIAGNPARVVKRNILWSDKEPWKYNGELYI